MSAEGGFRAPLDGAEVGFVVAGWIRVEGEVELVVFLIVIVILTAVLLVAVAVALEATVLWRDRGGNQSRRSPDPGTQLVE